MRDKDKIDYEELKEILDKDDTLDQDERDGILGSFLSDCAQDEWEKEYMKTHKLSANV